MKKVSIIYWSKGGNVELLANSIEEGAESQEAQVNTIHVMDATDEDVLDVDAIALGSPAMVDDGIEKFEMDPFVERLRELNIKGKQVVLFGTCGWRGDKFIHNWKSRMEDMGAEVIGTVVSHESLKAEEVALAKELGCKLAD